MIQKGTLYRSTLIAIAFLAAFGVLGYRLYHLQVVRHDELLAKVKNLHERKTYLAPVRGNILDARLNTLAQTVTVWNVAVDPKLIEPQIGEWTDLLSQGLGISRRELSRELSRPGRYVVLDKGVDEESVARIQERIDALNKGRAPTDRLRGLVLERTFRRYYPNGSLASHILGFAGDSFKEYDGQKIRVQRGIDGIEKVFDDQLAGTIGFRKIEKDRKGREMVAYRSEDVPPRNGNQLVLTVDQAIQHIVEEELDKLCEANEHKSATAIVVNPATGEILAMANRPTFDPNDPARDVEDMRNIAVADAHEPGSTFKVVTVSAALDRRVVTLDDSFFCENGKFLYAGYYLHDHKPYGLQTVRQIMMHSSNIGAAKIGLMTGEKALDGYIRRFGFGELSGIELPGEVKGLVRPPSSYSKISVTRISMGHEITATPLQVTLAMCAIANKGRLMKPMIVKQILDERGGVLQEFSPVVRRRVIDEKSALMMTEALRSVVSPDGTASKAAIPGWTVAGKTGTAQKLVNGRYDNSRYYSSFVGYFPAENPQLCIFVGLDDSTDYGGQVAAPAFREIGKRCAAYMDLKPPPGKATRTGSYAMTGVANRL